MGYGWATPYIVYGWKEHLDMRVIDCQWLQDKGLTLYGTDMYKNFANGAIYGIPYGFANDKIKIDEHDKKCVADALNELIEYCKRIKIEPPKMSDIGLYLAVHTDGTWSHCSKYNPDDEE